MIRKIRNLFFLLIFMMATFVATFAHAISPEARLTQARLATRTEELRIEAMKQTSEYQKGMALCNNQGKAYLDLFLDSVQQTSKLGIFDVSAYMNLYEHNGIPAETVGLLENDAFYLAMFDCAHNLPGNKDIRTIWKMAGTDITGRILGGILVYAGFRSTRALWTKSKAWGTTGKFTRGTLVTLGSAMIMTQFPDLATVLEELWQKKSKNAEKIENTTSQMKRSENQLVYSQLEQIRAVLTLAQEKINDPSLTEEKRAEWKAYAERLEGAIAFLD